MIKSIKIRNFQTLASLNLELSSGINVISGPSDSGKTSVIRAINWNLENRPSGFSFRRDPRKDKSGKSPLAKQDDTECSLVVEQGEITRLRNEASGEDSFNGYILPDDSEREALKGEVPEEVSQMLKISRYNVQMQHDPIFMLSDSPGEVARKINEITKMDSIDISRKRCESFISKTKESLDSLDKQISEHEESLKKLEYIEEANKRVSLLEIMEKELLDTEDMIYELQRAIDRTRKIEDEVSVLKEWLLVEKKASSLLELVSEYKETCKQVDELIDLTTSVHALETDIERSAGFSELGVKTEQIIAGIKTLNGIDDEIESVRNLAKQISFLSKQKEEAETVLLSHRDKYVGLIQEAGICPMCGMSIEDASQIALHIMEEI